MKALLLATLTMINASGEPVVTSSINVLPESSMCSSAMKEVVSHNNLSNNIFSLTRTKIKARRDNKTLTVTCEELEIKNVP